MVIYSGRGTDACSVVVRRNSLDFELLVDHANYFICFDNEFEAHYLNAFLNSSAPNEEMKDFQSKGLFGARNIHKKILDVFFPKFNEKSKAHIELAMLSEVAHQKAKAYIKANLPKQELSAIHLGRLRVDIKNHLVAEMKEIDELVKEVIG